VLKAAISGEFPDFQLTEYQSPDFEVIVSRVVEHIHACDYAKAHPSYSDLHFADRTVPAVVEYINKRWAVARQGE
jgi:hypothetical protein